MPKSAFTIINLAEIVAYLRDVGDDVLCSVYFNPSDSRLYVLSGDVDIFAHPDTCSYVYVGVFGAAVYPEQLLERTYFATLHKFLFG